jgi:dTDP-4-amino-4,6-dideoxygalactose transaminase
MADLAARHARVAAAVEARVLAVLREGRYVGGPVVAEAESRIAASMGWTHGVGVNSGTDALTIALQVLGVGPGDEVIVPAVSFFASAGAVCRAGATPVIADVRAEVPVLEAISLPLGPRTKAVMAVHLFGEPCDLRPLPCPVLDDVAQCAGASRGRGDIAALSFYPSKTLGAAGDGGMVLARDAGLASRARAIANHGMTEPNLHARVGTVVGRNSRLDAVQAAVLLAHLDDLPARVQARRAHAARYDAELPAPLRRVPRAPGHPVHHYLVRARDRDALAAHLRARGVETAVYYPRSLASQPAMIETPGAVRGATPNADAWCAENLALPVHECLSDGDIDSVVSAVRAFFA